MSQSFLNNNIGSFNRTSYSNNVWNNCTVAGDQSQLLTWLSPLEPRLRHQDIRERRVDSVGGWLMQTEDFRRWHDLSEEGGFGNAVLFCYGDPGVGKTFISSLVVDRLCDEARGQDTVITCFYYDFAARNEQSVTSMLASLLKQIVSGMERIPEEISRAFQEQKKAIGGRGLRLPDIVKMLQTITSSQRTFMCIDALDEIAVAHRAKLLDSLKQILEKSPRARIFLTGRPHIRAEVEECLARRVISVSIASNKGDVIKYLLAKLREDETPDAMDESLKVDILQNIPENISEMFLLVSLNVRAILQESTIHRRREKLSRITDGLGLADAYSATMERVKAQDGDKSRLGLAALMWISHAERPLQADELRHALAVDLGSPDFNPSNIPSTSTLVSCCQGLITVDKEASTVRLMHFTLQEYLSAHPDIFNRPHSAIAEICLTYLSSKQVKTPSADHPPNTINTPFLEYCSVYWGVHAKRELSAPVESLALNLAQEDYGHISTKFLLAQVEHLYHWRINIWSPFSGLHCASFFGIAEVVAALLEMGCDVNGRDFLGYTPLAWAAHNGHEKVVSILLQREEVQPDKPDKFGRTPLLFAAQGGHEGVAKMLLEREEVKPDKLDKFNQSPLSFAAHSGHERIVKMLLGREEVKPDTPDKFGRSPLSFAARRGHEEVVKMLLGREEVDPDKPGKSGRTPFSYAAARGYEVVVKMLLRRQEVNPDMPSNKGRTPLSFAAQNGHEGVVKMLLRRQEVNPDMPSNKGRTPLSFAAQNGHEGVVEMLLGREEVNPDKPNVDAQTPLSLAARYGHQRVLALLQSRKEGTHTTN